MKINWKKLVLSLLITVGTGLLSSFLTRGSMSVYESINRPSFSPPGILFPIVWSILFILMGIALYLVWNADSDRKAPALAAFGVQLVLNFIWSLIFFNARDFTLAFVWILILLAAIIVSTFLQSKVSKASAWLMVPYILWVAFASILTGAIRAMN
ncbi:MAG: tryptophan-rich sensory protein [Eubacteriales bacterium]|nr:tryptophan-rich sensory protein [Eubacteriales bacterium]